LSDDAQTLKAREVPVCGQYFIDAVFAANGCNLRIENQIAAYRGRFAGLAAAALNAAPLQNLLGSARQLQL